MAAGTVEIPIELAEAIVDLGRRLVPFIASGAGEGAPHTETFVNVPGQGPWTRKNVVDFKAAIARYAGASAVLNFAAEHPDEEVKYTVILDANPQLEHKRVAAELGAMSKVARKVVGEKMWPLYAWQASDGVMRYRMPAAIAIWWKGA